jgi:hypothetical protein
MAPANRKAIGQRTDRDQRLRKGIPTLAEMTAVFASEEAAVQYLLDENVLTIPVCPTCNRDCTKRPGKWLYRCQPHKYSKSIVSFLNILKSADLPKYSPYA